MKKKIKYIVGAILGLICVLLLIVIGYVIYVFTDYHRIEDYQTTSVEDHTSEVLTTGTTYKAMTYNIGFAAYTPDFSFFMDGGKMSRAKSKDSVIEVMNGIGAYINEVNPDIVLIEEIDTDSTRSHHVNELSMLKTSLPAYDASFAMNFDSPYLFWPLYSPHGKSKSGLLTLSKFDMGDEGLRRQLPVEDSVMKIVDLDRCYQVNRLPVDNGKELVLYTVHLSAYTSDGTISDEQAALLANDMAAEYAAGNYVICGGDFNKDLILNSEEVFNFPSDEYTWAKDFPVAVLEGTGLSIVSSLPEDISEAIPSCRNADKPYNPDQAVLTVDGFIVSDNVTAIHSQVEPLEFIYSDHNPVTLEFILN